MGAFLQWTTAAGLDKALYFDVVKEEVQEFHSEATEHPVEEGVNVSDHVKRSLNRVSLEVFVSNSPIEDVNKRGMSRTTQPLKFQRYKPPLSTNPLGAATQLIGIGVSAIGSLLGGNDEYSAQVFQFDTEFDAVAETLGILENLRDTVQLVEVVTPKRLHESMFLEKVSLTRNASTGDGGTLHLDFRELRKVKVSLVNAPVPTMPRADVAKNKGAKSTTPVADGPKKSIAKSLADRARLAFAGAS